MKKKYIKKNKTLKKSIVDKKNKKVNVKKTKNNNNHKSNHNSNLKKTKNNNPNVKKTKKVKNPKRVKTPKIKKTKKRGGDGIFMPIAFLIGASLLGAFTPEKSKKKIESPPSNNKEPITGSRNRPSVNNTIESEPAINSMQSPRAVSSEPPRTVDSQVKESTGNESNAEATKTNTEAKT